MKLLCKIKLPYYELHLIIMLCSIGFSSVAQKNNGLPSDDSTSVKIDSVGSVESLVKADSTKKTRQTKKPTKDTVDYEADIIEYDIANKIILLVNNGILRFQNIVLYADTIHYLFEEKMLIATGYPQLVDGTDTIAGENLVYDMNTQRGRIRYGSAHSGEAKYNGMEITYSDDKNFYMQDGDYTSCAEIDTPHYCFYSKHIKVTSKDKAFSRPVVLNIGGAPVAALPYFIIPLQHGRSSGWLSPKWGGNPTSGGYMDNIGYYWAPNDYADFLLSGKISEFSSYLVRARAQYKLQYWFNGSLDGKYSASTNHDTLNHIWAINYRHYQNILPDESMKLSGSGNIASGRTFYRSTSEDTTELMNQQVNANMSLTKNFKKIGGHGSINWTRNHNFKTNRVTQDLPSLSFSLNARPLIPVKEDLDIIELDDENREKWYNKISYSYNFKVLRKYSYDKDSIEQRNEKLNIFNNGGFGQSFSVSAPQKLFKYITFSPNFSLNHSLFDAYIDTDTTGKTKKFDTTLITNTVNKYDWDPFSKVVDTLFKGDDTLYVCSTSIKVDSFYLRDTINYYDENFRFKEANNSYWNVGARLSTQLFGVFPIKIFNFQGIRHTFTPSISYTYYPWKGKAWEYPNVGVGYQRARKEGQVISFSFGNLFQGKVLPKKIKDDKNEPEPKTFTMFTANASFSYDFVKELHKMSNISVGVGIPNKLIDFSFNGSLTPYSEGGSFQAPRFLSYGISLRPKLSGASGTFWGGDFIVFNGLQNKNYMTGYGDITKKPGWSLGFSPRYNFTRTRGSVNESFKTKKTYQLSTHARLDFTRIWSTSWGGNYDFTKNKFLNNSLNLYCDLECWDMKFNWYPSGINGGAFYFVVKIKKHPEIKWFRRDSDN